MLNIIDLFSGAGGLTEGFRANNEFSFLGHIEEDKDACRTLELRNVYYYLKNINKLSYYYKYMNGEISKDILFSNIPHYIIKNILNLSINAENLPIIFSFLDKNLQDKTLDGIIGGPPCQAYSTIGRAANKNKKKIDNRIYLYKYYLNFLKEYRPKFFIFENVKGLLSFKDIYDDLLLPKIIKEFFELGYDVKYEIIRADEFGVSQRRERLFIVGFRKDIKLYKSFFSCLSFYKEKACNLREIFYDLPSLNPGQSSNKYISTNINNSLEKIRNKYDILSQHYARNHNDNDLKIYRLVSEAKKRGENLKYTDLPKQLQTHSNKTSFLDRYKSLDYEATSHTVVAHISKDGHYYIHPDPEQKRSITIREASRIQGFPDNFFFEGSRTAVYKQIGNAVPPILSEKISRAIVDVLRFTKLKQK